MATATVPVPAATRPMTADEFYDFCQKPENRDRRFELERGEIVEMSLGGERHGVVCGNASYELSGYSRRRRQGRVCINDTAILLERDPDTMRGPDIAFYLDSLRYDDLSVRYTERLPDLIVEVLSPTDRYSKMLRRISLFLERGVKMVWLLDTDARDVTVYRPDKAHLVLEENEELTGFEVLPDFRCKVADFFAVPGE